MKESLSAGAMDANPVADCVMAGLLLGAAARPAAAPAFSADPGVSPLPDPAIGLCPPLDCVAVSSAYAELTSFSFTSAAAFSVVSP